MLAPLEAGSVNQIPKWKNTEAGIRQGPAVASRAERGRRRKPRRAQWNRLRFTAKNLSFCSVATHYPEKNSLFYEKESVESRIFNSKWQLFF